MANLSTKSLVLKSLKFLSNGEEFTPKELSELKMEDISFEPGRVRIKRKDNWEPVCPSKALIAWYRVRKEKVNVKDGKESAPLFSTSEGLKLTSEEIRELLQ